MLHQQENGRFAMAENPEKSLLFSQTTWQSEFGDLFQYKHPWKYYVSQGCQLAAFYPGTDDYGKPMRKGQCWIANFDLSSVQQKCEKPLASSPVDHFHRQIRGTMNVEGVGRNLSVAAFSGIYNGTISSVLARHIMRVVNEYNQRWENPRINDDFRGEPRVAGRPSKRDTQLKRMAMDSGLRANFRQAGLHQPEDIVSDYYEPSKLRHPSIDPGNRYGCSGCAERVSVGRCDTCGHRFCEECFDPTPQEVTNMGYTLIQTGYVADYGSIGSTPQERRRCHACCDPGCAEPYPVCSLIADNKEETTESLRLEFHKEFHLLPMGYLDGDTGQLYRYSSDETRCSGSLEKCYRYSAPPDLPEDEACSAVS